MARNTSVDHQNLVIYSIYVRAHGKNGNFQDVEKDLPRIKELGVDVIWFLPLHPIGKLKAKGSLGCPYSISDYRGINSEYGTEADFEKLVKRAHELGLKVIIDVVYHHTSHDSNLITEHPEWYRQNADGTPQTSVPEWSDIIDLNHPKKELTRYLIDSLRKWVEMGVDGFRCDVASCIPMDFWRQACTELREVHPNLFWLAESVNPDFIRNRRAAGLIAHSDSELYEVFDVLYDYDIWFMWKACVEGKVPVERYIEMLAWQDAIYERNYCKMRFVENHDQKRIMDSAASENQALAWTAFQAFNRGSFLIYGGQESKEKRTPSLFEKEPVDWKKYELSPFLKKLSQLKKDEAQSKGKFGIISASPCIQAAWLGPNDSLYGVFNVSGVKAKEVQVQAPDGTYEDILSGAKITVANRKMACPETAMIFRCKKTKGFALFIPEHWSGA